MKPLLSYWPIIVFALGTMAGGVRLGIAAVDASTARAAQAQKQADDNARLLERVRVLERITVQEHPEYSPTIYYEVK